MRFLDLDLQDRVSGATTIWLFREELGKKRGLLVAGAGRSRQNTQKTLSDPRTGKLRTPDRTDGGLTPAAGGAPVHTGQLHGEAAGMALESGAFRSKSGVGCFQRPLAESGCSLFLVHIHGPCTHTPCFQPARTALSKQDTSQPCFPGPVALRPDWITSPHHVTT